LSRRLRVFEIALHGHIPAEHDLAQRAAVPRHGLERVGMKNPHGFLHHETDTLATEPFGRLARRERAPFLLPHAESGGAVGLGEAVTVRELHAAALHRLERRRRPRPDPSPSYQLRIRGDA